jgi:hypothetical protein
MDDLSPRHRRFVELVASGMPAGRAYTAAGYAAEGASAEACASRLLGSARVSEALTAVQASTEDIADRAERQRFLTAVLRDGDQPTRDRLRACEILGRMAGDYATDRPDAAAGGLIVLTAPAGAEVDPGPHRVLVSLPRNGREAPD